MQKTAATLKDEFRIDVDDLPKEDGDTSACLWSDADIYRYMTSAASQVARRARTLRRIVTLPVTAAEPNIRLPDSQVLDVERAYLVTADRDLDPINLNDSGTANRDYGWQTRPSHGWETRTGTPTHYLLDYRPGYLRLYPAPTAADTLQLHVTSLPTRLTEGCILQFNDQEDQDLLVLWMKKMAYEKHDADTFDRDRAASFEQEFYVRARERESEFRRLRRNPGVVRSSW